MNGGNVLYNSKCIMVLKIKKSLLNAVFWLRFPPAHVTKREEPVWLEISVLTVYYGVQKSESAVTLAKKQLSIVNSVGIHEAELTQKSLSNQAAFCWSNSHLTLNMRKSVWRTFSKLPVTWVPIGMTGFCPQNFAEQW